MKKILTPLIFSLAVAQFAASQTLPDGMGEFVCSCLEKKGFLAAEADASMQIYLECSESWGKTLTEEETSSLVDYMTSLSSDELATSFLKDLEKVCPKYYDKIFTTAAALGNSRSGGHIKEGYPQRLGHALRLYRDKDWFNAEKAFSALIQEIPKDPNHWLRRGYCRYLLQDYYGALGDFLTAGEFNVDPKEYRASVGLAKAGIGDYTQAIPALTIAIKDFPDNSLIARELGTAHYWNGSSDSAIHFYEMALSLEPENYDNYYNLMYVYQELQNWNKAMDVVELAIDELGNRGKVYLLRAELHYDMEDYSSAVQDYALALDEGGVDSLAITQSLATSYYYLEDYEQALIFCNKIIQEYKLEQVGSFRDRGQVYLALEKYELALSDFNQVLELSPDDPAHYDLRGKALMGMEKWSSAEENFSISLSMYPEDGLILYLRGEARRNMQDSHGACLDFEAAVKLGHEPAKKAVSDYCGTTKAN